MSDNIPTNEKLWGEILDLARGKRKSPVCKGKECASPVNEGKGFTTYPSAYCVPLHSEALTPNGWVGYEELEEGDIILTYSFSRKGLVWSEVERLHFHEKAEVLRLTKQSLNLECTADHRWVYTSSSVDDVVDHNKMRFIWGLLLDIKEGRKKVSHIKKGIYSNIQHYWDRYRDASSYEDMISHVRGKKGYHLRPVSEMSLKSGAKILSSAPYLEPLQGDFKFTGKYRGSWVSDILKMNKEMLEAFFSACIMCDGWQISNGLYGFSQKDVDHGDAFELAAFLTGRRLRRRDKVKDCDVTPFSVNEKSYIPLNGTKIVPVGEMSVWCPQTSEGTWVMRQNGHITITGNSNGWALAQYKRLGGKWKKKASSTSPDALPTLQVLLALLRGAHWAHWTSHWQAKGDNSYGDHQLLDRIYTSLIEEIDTLAEKIVGYYGSAGVRPVEQAQLMANRILPRLEAKAEDDPIMRAYIMEEALQKALSNIYNALKDMKALSLGMDDYIMSIANAHETNLYLLRQRLRG